MKKEIIGLALILLCFSGCKPPAAVGSTPPSDQAFMLGNKYAEEVSTINQIVAVINLRSDLLTRDSSSILDAPENEKLHQKLRFFYTHDKKLVKVQSDIDFVPPTPAGKDIAHTRNTTYFGNDKVIKVEVIHTREGETYKADYYLLSAGLGYKGHDFKLTRSQLTGVGINYQSQFLKF